MKINLLCILLALLLFGSCVPTSHIAMMPNEPAFEKKGEVKIAGACGIDHAEGQAALSISNHLGFTGGYYRAWKGVNMYELGANMYFPISTPKKISFSLSTGFGEGKYDGQYVVNNGFITTYQGVAIDNYYTTKYFQFSLIKNNKKDLITKRYIISVKRELIDYKRYYMQLNSSAGLDAYTGSIYTTAAKKAIVLVTPFFAFERQKEGSPIYYQLQVGARLITKFSSEMQRLQGNYFPSDDLSIRFHPLISPFMFNIAVGVRL